MFIPNIPIKTAEKVISVEGKIFYNDRRRRIDVKKPIRDLFDNSSLDVFYTMELCLSENKLIERVKNLSKENIMPIILYFHTGGKNDTKSMS